MSITDELRRVAAKTECANGRCEKLYRGDLDHIADRIDAEYQKAEDEWKAKDGQSWLHGYGECHAKLMEGNEVIAADLERAGWIQLPKDADGVTIHLQDRMSWDNGMFNVHELNLTADGWTTWDELHGYTVRADQCHHAKPDSWERIIEDVRRRTSDYYCNQIPCDFRKMADEMVERCKRLAGEDE